MTPDSEPSPQRPSRKGQPFPKRMSFRPDGTAKTFDTARAPRPGRQEREAIRSGNRQFFRGKAAPEGFAAARPAGPRAPYPQRPLGASPRGPRPGYQDSPWRGEGQGRPPARPGYGRPAYGARREDPGYRAPARRDFGGPDERAGRPGYARPAYGARQEDPGYRAPARRDFGGPDERAGRPDYSQGRPAYDARREDSGYRDRPPVRQASAWQENREGRPAEAPRGPRGPRPGFAGDERRQRTSRADVHPDRIADAEAPGGMSAEAEVARSNPELVARIIEKATANIPADLLLRQTLARRKRLSPGDSAWICGAVFAYYRWLNWLPAGAPASARIEAALELAHRFQANPDSVPRQELQQHAVPAWIHRQLDATPAWLRSLQAEPVLWLRVRRSIVADLQRTLGDCEPSGLAGLDTAFRYRGTVDLFRHDLFQAGGFEIQDFASQAVGHVCAPKAGETWWDACAGEGGKTLHLSDLMDGKGLIWATDKSAYRLNRLKMRAGRAGCFNYRSGHWNGGAKLPTKTPFDGVLVDAPCTGVGTWGRNPHARWTTSETDVTELSAIQRQLLGNASAGVRPGGRLIYAVCTLTRAETTEVADAFTREHPEFEPLPLLNPYAPAKVPQKQLTLWPQETGGNGMFIAGWRRRIDSPVPAAPAAEAAEPVPVASER